MPKQIRRERFPQSPSPLRTGESWTSYVNRLRGEAQLGPEQMAGIMAAAALMRRNPGAPADQRLLDALGRRMLRQPSFRSLTQDPEALKLARGGKGAELIVMMGEKRERSEQETAAYGRSPQDAEADARILRSAVKSMKESFASRPSAQREREGKLFREMLRRMDHAASLSEQGIPLDGKTARELTQCVRRYVDGGSALPGGRRPAAAFRQAMCVLKRFMPEKAFSEYCGEINQLRKTRIPNYKRELKPGDFSEDILTGEARTAREYMLAAQRRMLKNGATLDGCAVVTAVMQLCGGNPNAVIQKSQLQSAVSLLEKPGSSFMRVMEDKDARAQYTDMAAGGDVTAIGRHIIGAAREHTARAAQWQIRNNLQKAGQQPGSMSPERMANILAARLMAAGASPDQPITNGAFHAKAEQIRNSPGFAQLAAQYRQDQSFRSKIDGGFASGDAGKALEQEFFKNNLIPQRKQEQEVTPALHT